MIPQVARGSEKETFRLLRGQRRKKLFGLYKLAVSITIDLTIALYLLGFAVLALSFFWANILTKLQTHALLHVATLEVVMIGSLVVFGWSLVGGLYNPRYRFTYSDFLLQFLPVQMRRYQRYVFVRSQVKRVGVIMILLLALSLLGLISWGQAGLLIVWLPVTDAIGGMVQWRIFQLLFWQRILYCVLLLGVAVLVFAGAGSSFAWIGFELLVALGLWVLDRFQPGEPDWQRVIAYGEDAVWNPLFIKLVLRDSSSVQTLTRPWIQKKQVANKRAKRVKQLPYEQTSLLQRYWFRYLPTKKKLWIQTFFILLLISNRIYAYRFPIPESTLFAIASLILIFVGKEIVVERLHTPQFSVLPWSVDAYVKSYFRVTWWGIVPFCFIQICMMWLRHVTPLDLVLFLASEMGLYLLLYNYLLRHSLMKLQGRPGAPFEQWVVVLVYGCAVLLLQIVRLTDLLALLFVCYLLWKRRGFFARKL